MKPWEKYQNTEQGPWMKYQSPQTDYVEQRPRKYAKPYTASKGYLLPQWASGADFKPGDMNIYGDVFQRPGDALLSLITGQGYAEGAVNPQNVESVQSRALRNFAPKTESVALNFLGGLPASTIGLAGDIARQPANLIALLAGELQGVKQAGQSMAQTKPAQAVGRFMSKERSIIPKQDPSKLITKAQKITTELMQPSKTQLVKYLDRGQEMPAIREAAKVIKKSKNYTQLRNNIDDVIKSNFTKRNAILKKNNFKVSDDYLTELKSLIQETKQVGQATPAEIKTMEGVLSRELAFIKKNPNFDRLSAQARKEMLQNITQKLLKKLESGDVIDTEPARNLALNAIRKGLRRVVNAGDEQVIGLNDTYEGLKDARWYISGQEALSQKAVPESIIQKAIRFITRPKDIPLEVSRGALERQMSLPKRTAEIEKLMRKAKQVIR